MPESVQSCFELSIHFPCIFFPRTIFSCSSRLVRYTDKCTSNFHTNTVISRRVCLLVKMASKTVIRPINQSELEANNANGSKRGKRVRASHDWF